MKWVTVIACCAISIASNAYAAPINLTLSTPGWTYFNRPGADLRTHDAELRSCLLTASTVYPLRHPDLVELVMMPANAVIDEVIAKNKEAARIRPNTENCMVVHGWRVVRVPEEEGRRLAALKHSDLAEQLSGWVGAEQPHGDIARRWENESIHRGMITDETLDASTSVSLSLLALTSDEQFLQAMANPVRPTPTINKGQFVPTAIPLSQIDKAPPGVAVIVVTLRGPEAQSRTVTFIRMNSDLTAPAWNDNGPYSFAISSPKPQEAGGAPVTELTLAFAVPPGPWKFAGFNASDWGHGGGTCLGSPFFEVSAGEVVYAGAFDFGRDELSPDMSFRPEDIIPPEAPAARARMRPAKWVNGALGDCLTPIYATEFPGMPYVDGYRGGGAAPGNSN